MNTLWTGSERRRDNCRRRSNRRRANSERRCDTRHEPQTQKRSFYRWARSITHARLGVDRRKISDQRVTTNRRDPLSGAMLTKEELADLLD